jgi:hypothetical protein
MGEVVKWLIVAYLAAGGLASIAVVGKPRGPMTGTDATIVIVLVTLAIVGILIFWE